MAEAAVEIVTETLSSLLLEEIKLLGRVKREVESIKRELESIRSFLKDADARAAVEEEGEGNEGVSTWVKQVREEAYHIEDVLDEYMLNKAKHPHDFDSDLMRLLCKMCCFINELILSHGISSKIEDIKSSLAGIQERRHAYNFSDQGSSSGTKKDIPHDSRVGSFFIEDAEVVGIESTRDELIGLLVNETPHRSVIAVVGAGGLGKTTLVGKIYNNDAVQKHFSCQAWITVGKEYVKEDLLRTIIREVYRPIGTAPVEIEKMEESHLIKTLSDYLKDKCYMLVFDDIWKTEFWGDVKPSLGSLVNNKTSRIILTTRDRRVADSVSSVKVHELQPLPYEKAWELFCIKTFGRGVGCPPELEKLSQDILAKCGGLPLAIVAVGGLLSNKIQVVSEWQNLLNGLGSKLGSDPHLKDCNRVLSEGYYDLPSHLKSCLLYFGLFPESYKVSCARLIRLWLAEGFVSYSKIRLSEQDAEQVAEGFLTDLINRSVVQVVKTDVAGRPRICRVHGLMHEIILRKTKYLGFSHVVNREVSGKSSKIRRISIQGGTYGVLKSSGDSKIRSVFLFNINQIPNSFMTALIANFELIKVLDFEDGPIEYVPEGVGNLFHLHYLSVKNTKVKVLPKSIGKNLNLETLNLKHSLIAELPLEIKNLKKLRYLLVYHVENNFICGVKIPKGLGSLMDLQKLLFVEANSEELKELTKLKHLRRLGIRLTNTSGKDLCACVPNMGNLESLAVYSTSREETLDIESMVCPLRSLQRLDLKGNMKVLPDWIFKLESIMRIELDLSGLTDDPMRVLQSLPNLMHLTLIETYHDEQLHFKEGWFPKLEKLELTDFKGVELMMIDKGAMPNLSDLTIGPSPILKEIPTGIEHLRNLKFLEFRHMLKEIYYMIKDENWQKVTQHIPKVGVTFSKEGKESYVTAKDLSSVSPVDFEQNFNVAK